MIPYSSYYPVFEIDLIFFLYETGINEEMVN